ncbi:ArsB/NhaD family transporter [Geodermatophilus aquaeductus]|uniref:Arsenite efflux membrane protein ArsB n=1 Tax=Geodermatophilus aquaeductus TaxID=1564161 RepID=A0A521DQH2_9ACTN|nr:SLC13 family permease [Geodermatophilus aquaeductus]SMO73953.1 arsenite efflux membrane protein ArsB [Geodermatophilus aquaeductus]
MVDPLALGVSAVVLGATLVSATATGHRVPPSAVALTGAVYLVLVGAVGFPAAETAVREVLPTVAFLVVVLVLADCAAREGVFRWAAAATARRAGRSPHALLRRVVVLAAGVTAVLSIDATAVLLTPVVLATAARMRVPARPHAVVTGHLANSASLLLPISNLTNLLAFAATGLTFLHFAGLMLLPQVAAVAVEYLVLRRVFRADLDRPVPAPVTEVPPPPRLGLAVVGLSAAGAALASSAGLSPVWAVAAGTAVLAGRQLATGRVRGGELVTAADLPFAAFVCGLAVVVSAVLDAGLETGLARLLPDGEGLLALLTVAVVAAVLANVVNNLPATLALLPVAVAVGPGAVLAVLVGVNIGPNLTYVGSLANLLWRRALGTQAPTAARFSAVGLATVPLTLLAATVALWISLQV